MFKLSVYRVLYNWMAVLLVLAIALGALGLPSARAASPTVSNTDDGGPGSLRQAKWDANGNSEADTITLASAARSYSPAHCPPLTAC